MTSKFKMEPGLKVCNAVVWTTKWPALKYVSESSFFLFQGSESHLRLAYNPKHDSYVIISIHKKSGGKEYLPFEVTTFIDGSRGPIYYYRKLVENTSGYLNSYYVPDVSQKLDDLKFNGTLTFVCIFHGEVHSPHKPIKDLNMTSPDRLCACPNRYCLENSTRDLCQMMDDTSTHDLKVKAGEKTATAHKSVLAESSKVLAEMLQNKDRHLDILEIEGLNPEILKDFIHYMYTKKLFEMTLENAKRLYQAGEKFAMEDLKKRCTEFIVQKLTMENVYDYLLMADLYQDAYFKNGVISYAIDKRLPLQEKWDSFGKDHPVLAIEVLNQCYKSRCT